MRPDTQLDYANFQLNPTRTRCELHISAQGMTYKLAAGLLQPFVAHLKAAEEQIAGGGYSVHLEPPDPGCAGWFTKGTMERFVRFVSTPEVLELASNIEMELLEIEKNIRLQSGDASEDTQYAEELLLRSAHSINFTGGMPLAPEHLEKSTKESSEDVKLNRGRATKQQLLGALEARQMRLQEELGVALARAIAAGFTLEHIKDLIAFAEIFGAKRLWGACSNFISLCKTRQQSEVRQDDLKSSEAEVAFGGNVAHHKGFIESLDLQGRGSRQDDLRRASLPIEGRPLVVDSGLEKLTRRGSLDELTGEFLQVAARMRSSGMMVGANLDWPNNWQAPIGRGNRPVSGEMQVGAAHFGGSGDLRDSESALKLARGHQMMAAWRGQPPNHSMHNLHPMMHGSMHQSTPSSFGFPGLSVPGYSYPPYSGNPYMGHPYADANVWQLPSAVPLPFWPHPMFNTIAAPAANERGEVVLPTSQKHEANYNTLNNNDCHEDLTPSRELCNMDELHGNPSSSTQRSANDQPIVNELHEKTPGATETAASDPSVPAFSEGPTREQCDVDEFHGNHPSFIQRSANDQPTANKLHGETPGTTEIVANDLSAAQESPVSAEGPAHELNVDSTQRPADDLPVSEQTVITQQKLPNKNEHKGGGTDDSFHDGDDPPFPERTRRLPIRSSSPSRRSASPLKKVQIGFSASRRPIRNASSVAQSISEKLESHDKEATITWREDSDKGKIDEEAKGQTVRARVQDVIGLFERKKDVGDTEIKPLRKEIGRIQSKNSVLKRWTESGALKKETSEMEIPITASGASADDVTERGGISERKEEGMSLAQEENAELAVASKIESCPEPQASDKQRAAKGSNLTRRKLLSPASEVPNNQSLGGGGDLAQTEQNLEPASHLVPEGSEELGGKSCNMLRDEGTKILGTGTVDDDQSGQEKADLNMLKDDHAQMLATDMVGEEQSSQEKTDANGSLDDVQEKEDGSLGVNPKALHSNKVSAHDAKTKAMQELLQKRKAASGNRFGKPNPMAEAQSRAEKLRAYKAGLQKCKQEKDEEEKKRIEDLKSQRKERISARGSPQGGSFTQSPISRQAPQTPPLVGNKPPPTVNAYKLSSSSPRKSINVLASSLSPKSKGVPGNKLPRTPSGTPKGNENALSLPMLSLSDLKKESPKAMLAVWSSTGAQRLSQPRKNLKDADPNTSPKANGHSEEKRRSLPLTTIKKGTPPAKESKNEGSPVVKKPGKGAMAANKKEKKPGSSPASVKSKKLAKEAMEATSFSEKIDATNYAAAEASLELDTEAGNDKEELLSAGVTEVGLDINSLSVQENGTTEDDEGYAQIRAPASSETEILNSADDSLCLVDGELAISSESFIPKDLEETEDPMAALDSDTVFLARIEDEHTELNGDKNADDSYCAPVAHVSPTDETSIICKDLGASREESTVAFVDENQTNLNVLADELPCGPPTEVNNPPCALPTDSPLHTSKNLPRLHEAIQQAHSPEFMSGVNQSRKTQQSEESGSVRSSKDHAKGFKRLLLFSRKSKPYSSQKAADGVSVSMVSEAGNDGEGTSSNAKKMGSGSAIESTDGATRQADKPRVESYSGNTSSKGSRSFFSLSNLRGKGEGK